jgi:phosphatidylglycerophosphatase A
LRSLSSLLATFFGVGFIPIASGTFGSAAALPFGFVFVLLGWPVVAAASVAATAAGVWACGEHAAKLGVGDPSECVLDEVAGQWIALLPIALYGRPFDWAPYAVSFFLFRLFDVLKLWPLSAAERLPGGYGIMADDVLAGLIAAGLLWAALANGWV